MQEVKELKELVKSLEIGEKRTVKMLGNARARNRETQILDLFDWLDGKDESENPPSDPRLLTNLPTLSVRLKDLILDGLQLLHQENTVDGQLRTALTAVEILTEKKLYPAAARRLKRAKKLALTTSRYHFGLQCLEAERRLLPASAGNAAIKAHRTEEREMTEKLLRLQELRHRHEFLRVRASQISLPRNLELLLEIREMAEESTIAELAQAGGYVEKGLAANILGIGHLLEGRPAEAVKVYGELLKEWRQQSDWQIDQAQVLMSICRQYQSACFLDARKSNVLEQRLALMPDFKQLPASLANDFQRLLFHHQFTLSLNRGFLDQIPKLIEEIMLWLNLKTTVTSPTQQLPFFNNFAVAEFLSGNFKAANRHVQRILNLPERSIRQDIRDFALVLQAVIQFELGDDQLNEYLTRAGKRRFRQNSREVAFELAVFSYLQAALRKDVSENEQLAVDRLLESLDALASGQGSGPHVIGLMEMRLWAKSKQLQQPIKEVFLAAVRENLESLG
ncbi:MAG: hypothetical protein RLZZ519_2611 [Bacteroidota bacterium]|jgi:hypothetical protein